MALHKNVAFGEVHVAYAFEYADATARTSASLTTSDVGKLARQLDNNTFWVLNDDSPLTWTQIDATSATDSDAIHDNVSGEISAITEKTTPVGADLLLIEDSAASNAKKKVQITNLPGGGGTDVDDENNILATQVFS